MPSSSNGGQLIQLVCILWLSFLVYSVAGRLFEEITCSVEERRVVNRGFLNGPYCPIYGAGALLAAVGLGWVADAAGPFALFLASSVACCAVEYLTSYIMERRYHARWWDYSNRFLNLNGRICLAGGVLFGAACTVVVLAVQPWLSNMLASLPQEAVILSSFVTLALFAADVVATHVGPSGFRVKVDALCGKLTEQLGAAYSKLLDGDGSLFQALKGVKASGLADFLQSAREKMPGAVAIEDVVQPLLDSFLKQLNAQERRVINAFPGMRIASSSELAKSLRDYLLNIEGPREGNRP